MTRACVLLGLVILLALAAPARGGTLTAPVAGLGEIGRSECIDLPKPADAECGRNYLEDIALSPDGRHVYAVSARGDAVHVLRRTGAGRVRRLSGPDGCVAQAGEAAGCRPGRGLRGAVSVRLSADGRSLYVAGYVTEPAYVGAGRPGPASSTIAVFAVDPSSGALTQLPGTEGCVGIGGTDGGGNACTPVRGVARLGGPRPSPDGRNVYATFIGTAAFARDGSTGALTQLPGADGCVLPAPADPASGCAEAGGVDNALDTAVSPDGRSVYLPNHVEGYGDGSGGVASFSRDPSTGALRQLDGPAGCHAADGRTGCSAVPDRADGSGAAISPDGRHVYLLGQYGFATYARDQATGALTYTGCTSGFRELRDCAFTPVAPAAWAGLAFAPDGRTGYAASAEDEDGLLTLSRDPSSGRLSQAACTVTNVTKRCMELGDAAPTALVVAPDGALVGQAGPTIFVMRDGLSLGAGSVTVSRRGTAPLRVRCDSRVGGCAGRLSIVALDEFGAPRGTFARGRYAVRQGETATAELTFTRAGRSDMQLERSTFYTVQAATRTGGVTVTTRRSVRFNAPAGGFGTTLAPERPGRCLPRNAQTVARTSRGRLYRLRNRAGLVYVYGCLNAVGRGFPLEDFDDLDNGHHFTEPHALAGRYVAYPDNYIYEYAAEPGTNYTSLRVVDLATGRTLRQACVEPNYCDGPVDDLVLAPSGAVAWIAANRVWRLSGRRKKPERLAGGADLDLESLKLRGSRLTWREDGRTRAATLR